MPKTVYSIGLGTVSYGPGDISKTISILINDDSFVEGPESFTVTLANPVGATLGAPTVATVTITDDFSEPLTNVIDDAQNFVFQQYHDFLNRQPDSGGLNFLANQITSCGSNAACLDNKRNNVSAAFFVSIEFQNTGYFVYRTYNGTLTRPNNLPTYVEFLRDTQTIQRGIIVGQGNWQQALDDNKTTYCSDVSSRAGFVALYPLSMTATQYVDALFAHALITPTAQERQAAIDEFNNPTGARGRALRKVVENPALTTREFNRAFVLMQYFGYLRRDPNAAPDSDLSGLNFWLNKLNSWNGDYIKSEMVRSFLLSGEYRNRFGLQ
jgi:hypothetical protein